MYKMTASEAKRLDKGNDFKGLLPVLGKQDMPQHIHDEALLLMDPIAYGTTRTVYDWTPGVILKVDGVAEDLGRDVQREYWEYNFWQQSYIEASLWVAERDGYRGHLLTPVLAIAESGRAILMKEEPMANSIMAIGEHLLVDKLFDLLGSKDSGLAMNQAVIMDDFGDVFAGRVLDYSR